MSMMDLAKEYPLKIRCDQDKYGEWRCCFFHKTPIGEFSEAGRAEKARELALESAKGYAIACWGKEAVDKALEAFHDKTK